VLYLASDRVEPETVVLEDLNLRSLFPDQRGLLDAPLNLTPYLLLTRYGDGDPVRGPYTASTAPNNALRLGAGSIWEAYPASDTAPSGNATVARYWAHLTIGRTANSASRPPRILGINSKVNAVTLLPSLHGVRDYIQAKNRSLEIYLAATHRRTPCCPVILPRKAALPITGRTITAV